MESNYVSIIEYARHHNISDMTVRRRIKTGKLYAVLRDGKYFIPMDGSKEMGQGGASSTSSFTPKTPSFEAPRKPAPPPRVPTPPKESFSKSFSYEAPKEELSYDRVPREESKSISDERLRKIDRLLNGSSTSRSSLESKKLIELCEKVLAKIEKSEFFLEEKFFGKFDSVESELNILRSRFEASNLRVGRLEKKIEELKMLVDIMESEGFSS